MDAAQPVLAQKDARAESLHCPSVIRHESQITLPLGAQVEDVSPGVIGAEIPDQVPGDGLLY